MKSACAILAVVSAACIASAPCTAWAAEPDRAAPRSAIPLLVELDYALSPTDCPNETEFRKLVIQQIGYDPFRAPALHRVTARAQPTEHGIVGSLEWRSREGAFEGERMLSSQTGNCHEFATKMSFAVAVQIQFLASESGAASNERAHEQLAEAERNRTDPNLVMPAGAMPSSAQPGAVHTASDEAADKSKPSWFGAVGLGSALGSGFGSDMTVLGRVFASAHYGSASLELGGEGSWPTTSNQSDSAGIKRQWLFGSLALCKNWQALSACALGKLGQVRVRGFGVDNIGDAAGLVAQTGVRVSAELKLNRRLSLLPRAEVLYAPGRWQVQLNRAFAWETAPFNGLLGIDFGLSFR